MVWWGCAMVDVCGQGGRIGGNMRENRIEQQLCHAVRRQGGIALKLASPSYAGLPDRLVLLPGGHMAFVEVKAPGRKPRALQYTRLEHLARLGFRVYVLDESGKIGGMIRDIQAS